MLDDTNTLLNPVTPAPPSTPRKLSKAADGVFLPPDRNEKPRASPVVRKSALNVTTGEPLDSDSDDPTTPRRIVAIRYNVAPVASTTPPASPSPSIEGQDSDQDFDDQGSDEDMNTDQDMNTPPPQDGTQNGQALPGAALGQAGTALLAAIAPDILPSHGQLMALVPIGRAQNDHLARIPAQPAPTNNAEGRAPYMKNNGNARNIIITSSRTYDNVQPTQRDEVEAHRDE